jgi:hypothetical protein
VPRRGGGLRARDVGGLACAQATGPPEAVGERDRRAGVRRTQAAGSRPEVRVQRVDGADRAGRLGDRRGVPVDLAGRGDRLDREHGRLEVLADEQVRTPGRRRAVAVRADAAVRGAEGLPVRRQQHHHMPVGL